MGVHRFSAIVPILAILYGLGFTNLFLRSSFGVMAPDLAREMALEPAALSMVASAFFFAYAAMQVPTGMLLDRFGPRADDCCTAALHDRGHGAVRHGHAQRRC